MRRIAPAGSEMQQYEAGEHKVERVANRGIGEDVRLDDLYVRLIDGG
jgi:hypothetical protein